VARVRGRRPRRVEPRARAHPRRAGARVRIERRLPRGRPRAARRSRSRSLISRTRSALFFAVVISLVPAAAHGQQPDPERTVERRPIPDYGRAPEPEEPAAALLWIPRILFLPLHVVLEYLVRLPLGWVLRAIELERLDAIFRPAEMPQLARPEARWSFLPRARFDYGLQPSVGLALRVHDDSE